MIDVNNGKTTRTWDITLRSVIQPEMQIEHMFDANGSETFDPTETVEVSVGGELLAVEAGDTFIFNLVSD